MSNYGLYLFLNNTSKHVQCVYCVREREGWGREREDMPYNQKCPQQSEEDIGYSGVGVPADCEIPAVDAGNKTLTLCESSKAS